MKKYFILSASKPTPAAFTLVELIIVIVIVGILAAMGISQYANLVEKERTAEAKIRIGTMRKLAYQYYVENGSLANLSDSDVGVNNTCASTDFYRYHAYGFSDNVCFYAYRCTGSGKTPNASSGYLYMQRYFPAADSVEWFCRTDGGSSCFGLTTGPC